VGRASVTTTIDVYGKLLPGSSAQAVERVNAYLGGTGGGGR
jgi:hypothetical protein